VRDSLSLGLIILLAGAVIGFGGGWWTKGCTITPHTDTVRVEIPVQPGESMLDSSSHIVPVIRYIRWEDSSRIDSLAGLLDSLYAEFARSDVELVVVLDTTLTRYESTPETTYTLMDTLHVEYVYPPVSIFRNISLKHSPFEVRKDTVLKWDEVTGFQIFRDGKYILLGAVGTLAVIQLIDIIKR